VADVGLGPDRAQGSSRDLPEAGEHQARRLRQLAAGPGTSPHPRTLFASLERPGLARGAPAVRAILDRKGDPAGYIPPEALVDPEAVKAPRPKRSKPAYELGKDARLAAEALQFVNDVDDYNRWIEVGQSLSCLDSAGLRLWDDWSADSAKYQDGDTERKWRSFRLPLNRTLAMAPVGLMGLSPPATHENSVSKNRTTNATASGDLVAEEANQARQIHQTQDEFAGWSPTTDPIQALIRRQNRV
jgi:hypothetical protein